MQDCVHQQYFQKTQSFNHFPPLRCEDVVDPEPDCTEPWTFLGGLWGRNIPKFHVNLLKFHGISFGVTSFGRFVVEIEWLIIFNVWFSTFAVCIFLLGCCCLPTLPMRLLHRRLVDSCDKSWFHVSLPRPVDSVYFVMVSMLLVWTKPGLCLMDKMLRSSWHS